MEDQVTLSAYVDQVRELIRHDRNDEAIAICRHILRYYPKFVDAYRQMGEAYLEKHDYDSAKALFRRVLSADPENVIAYVGLATVFEEEHALNEAAWHIERAFELAPGNPELQSELIRVLNEVELKSHTRAKLTAGALGRVYAQSGLYGQAVQEFRTVIANSPARFDIRVALAETLWRTGHISQAAQVAQSLLEQLPYCLKANLILGAAWKESGLPESDLYLQRAQLLDPMNQTAIRLWGAQSPLSAHVISIPRYVEGAEETAPAPTAPQVEFPKFITETLAEEPADFAVTPEAPVETETLPQWLQPTTAEALPAQEPTPEAVPAWLQSATPETPAVQKPVVTEPIAETPAWLGELTQTPTIETPTPTAPQEETPTWLSELTQAPTAEIPALTAPVAELPAEITEPVAQEPTAELAELPETPTEQVEAAPTWLAELGKVETDQTPALASDQAIAQVEEPPSWLKDLTPSEPPSAELSAPQALEPAVSSEAEEWLKDLDTSQPALPEVAGKQPGGRIFPPQEELPPWLQGFEELGYKPSPGDGKPELVSTEKIPDWLMQLDQGKAITEEKPAVELPAVEPLPTWLAQPIEPVTAPGEERTQVSEIKVEAEPIAQPTKVTMPPPEMAEEPAVAVTTTPSAPPTSKRKRQPRGYSRLVQARAYRDADQIAAALTEYDYLVQHAPRLVQEVIDDLELLIHRLGIPIEAHRILGDAYNRANRLADALERYRFVLEHVE